MSSLKDASNASVQQKKNKKISDWSLLRNNHPGPSVPPGFPPKCNNLEAGDPNIYPASVCGLLDYSMVKEYVLFCLSEC